MNGGVIVLGGWVIGVRGGRGCGSEGGGREGGTAEPLVIVVRGGGRRGVIRWLGDWC